MCGLKTRFLKVSGKLDRFENVRNVEWIESRVGTFIMWRRTDTGCGGWFSTFLAQTVEKYVVAAV